MALPEHRNLPQQNKAKNMEQETGWMLPLQILTITTEELILRKENEKKKSKENDHIFMTKRSGLGNIV